MIELRIKGPRKKEIQNLLRQKSLQQKDDLQMLRLKYGSLKEYDTKKFIQISLPKIDKLRRKNDLAKVISLQVLNKIQQNRSLTDQEAQNLAKMSSEKKSNKLLIKTQVKEDFSDGEIFHGSQHMMNLKQQTVNLKDRILKVQDFDEKRRFSLGHKKSINSIKKISRNIKVNSIQRLIRDGYSDSLSRKYKQKKKAMQEDRQLVKQQRSMFMKLIDKRLSPSICVIKKLKTEPHDISYFKEPRTQVLRKIRSKEQLNQERHKSEKINFKTIENVKVTAPPFQVSLGPWGTNQNGFNF